MYYDYHRTLHPQAGWIEVIAGSMFSGKTEELMRRLRRATLANQEVVVFKSPVDKRYSETEIVSHDKNSMPSVVADSSQSVLHQSAKFEVIGIDEAQFFDNKLPKVCNQLANLGKRIIVAGLDMDYQGQAFGPMPELMVIAENVTKVHAICVRCGNLAHYSHRKSEKKDQILTGSMEEYEPLCRSCFVEQTQPNNA